MLLLVLGVPYQVEEKKISMHKYATCVCIFYLFIRNAQSCFNCEWRKSKNVYISLRIAIINDISLDSVVVFFFRSSDDAHTCART